MLSVHKRRCSTFVEVGSSLVCDPSELTSALAAINGSDLNLYSFDHVFPTFASTGDSPSSPPVVIAYGQLGTKEFQVLHRTLKPLAEQGQVKYIFRHYQPVSVSVCVCVCVCVCMCVCMWSSYTVSATLQPCTLCV